MKCKIIVINNIKFVCLLLITIIFVFFFAFKLINRNDKIAEREQEKVEYKYVKTNNIETNNIETSYNTNKIKVDFPSEIEGSKVIGKIEIPKINLVTYILSETTKDTLSKSVTKLCGPKINGVGNLCIAGHNYNNKNMFRDLKKLEIGDNIFITNMKGNNIEYFVYDIYKVYPSETECLSQETGGEREITLITCTQSAIKRLIIKAREFYD